MPSKKQNISELGEKKLIKRLLNRSPDFSFKSSFFDELTLISRRDDAALLNFKENYLVSTTDLLTRSAHFPKKMSYKQIGKKIVTVNVSDIAAMGADTLGITIAMALPNLTISEFDDLVDGISEACQKYNMPLIGGDTNESDELTLCGTCLGIIEKDEVLLKSGAEPGDIVAVSGHLGLAAAGFEILFADKLELENINSNVKNTVLKHALEPEARLEEGLKLAKSGSTTSATDITDGLLSEIGEIMESNESNIGITIFEEKLPIPQEVYEISAILNKNPLEMALTYGEDFELLVTVKKEKFNELKDEIGLYEIGLVTKSGQVQMVNKEGKTNILNTSGYEHFK